MIYVKKTATKPIKLRCRYPSIDSYPYHESSCKCMNAFNDNNNPILCATHNISHKGKYTTNMIYNGNESHWDWYFALSWRSFDDTCQISSKVKAWQFYSYCSLIFFRTESLKTPSNMLITNLAASDLIFSTVNGFPLLSISAFNRKWMWGDTGKFD